VNLRPVVRASAPIAVAASLGLLLTACGSSKSPSATPSASPSSTASPVATGCDAKPGAASDAVTVTGAYGKTPTVAVKGALSSPSLQRTVAIKGSGAQSVSGDTVNAHLSLFDATGKKIVAEDAKVPLSSTVRPVFVDALSCVNYGSRTVVTAPASQIYGASLPAGVKATDTLILVTDVESKYTAPPPPKPAAWKTQLPTVTFGTDGKPKVKLQGKPMAAWSLEVLKQGTGAVVQPGASVTVFYQGINWNTGKVFDQNFGGTAATFSTAGGVIPGFGDAIIGQKVGTRFIVTMPPKLGYGTNKNDPNARGLGGQTLVFVIEIVKTGS